MATPESEENDELESCVDETEQEHVQPEIVYVEEDVSEQVHVAVLEEEMYYEESESESEVYEESESESVVEQEEKSKKMEPEGIHVDQDIFDPEVLAALPKAEESKEEENTTTMIQEVLAKLISASEEGQDMDPEALTALQKAATKVVYVCLKNADDFKDDFLHSGETTVSLMSHALLEEAEKYYSNKQGNEESSTDYSAALQSVMAGNGDESEEGQEDSIDPEVLTALQKAATKVLYRCLKNADDLEDDVLHSWEMTASLMRHALLEEAETYYYQQGNE